jgi:CheY-like chemotaxis protein
MSQQQSPFASKDVVIIDDDPNSLEIAQILLEKAGAIVHTAVNGKEGLAVIQKVTPALVICDLSMPVMDGWSVIKAMRGNPELKTIPVIVLTAHAMAGDREKTLDAGFYNYLTKPLFPSMFIQDLLVALSNHPLFNVKS